MNGMETTEDTENTGEGTHAETQRRGGEELPPRPSAEEVDAAIMAHSLFGLPSSDVLIAETLHLRARFAELEAALKGLRHAYTRTLENGRDRIVFLGGECDSLEMMIASDHDLTRAMEVLAASGGGVCRYSGAESSRQPDLTAGKYQQNGAALIDHGTPRANDACDAYGKGDTTAFYGAAKSLAAKDAAETQGRSTQPPWVRGVVYPSNPETEEQAIQRAEALEGGEL